MWVVVSICVLISAVPSYTKVDFTGDKVYRMTPSSDCQVDFLKDLQNNDEDNALDVWFEPTTVSQPVTMRVLSSHTGNFENKLKSQQIKYQTLSNNLQNWVSEEEKENPPDGKEAGLSDDYGLDTFHTYESISVHLNTISKKYPKIASLKTIGTTHNNNDILGLKLGSDQTSTKPAIWIDAGIHAREWIGPASALYIINQFVKGYEEGHANIINLLSTFDWYIFPVLNVDGYIYTWEEDRMWRKNRAPSDNPNCVGADPNRNFDISFGGIGTSSDPCSNTYHGKSPFSEAESRAVRDGILKLGSRLQAYVDLHSYSQLILCPYGFGDKKMDNFDDTMKLMNDMARAIYLTHGKTYKVGPIATTIYPVSGSSVDWAKEVANVKYSLSIEERDTGSYGFMLNKSEIIPTSEEMFAAINVLAKTLQKEMAQQTYIGEY